MTGPNNVVLQVSPLLLSERCLKSQLERHNAALFGPDGPYVSFYPFGQVGSYTTELVLDLYPLEQVYPKHSFRQ